MSEPAGSLARTLGLPSAVLLGLGSILGTGVFVSIGLAASGAGSHLLSALGVAAILATVNGLASANLAATYPVAGGTYEYGYRTLGPAWGFAAGWMFLVAKSASMAAAALGFASYAAGAGLGVSEAWIKPLAATSVLAVTLATAGGMRRSNRVNSAMVATTLVGLASFVVLALTSSGERTISAPPPTTATSFLGAVALLFVAYTGYGRVATLGEEVKDPERTIPRAVVTTLIVALAVYLAVAYAALQCVGAHGYAAATVEAHGAALAHIARGLGSGGVAAVVTLASLTAMLGVQLNLSLGLSRVVLAMARRKDLPGRFAALSGSPPTPKVAALLVGCVVATMIIAFDLKLSWSFSAFNVLLYYALTNLAALRLPLADRKLPRFVPLLGLLSCAFLAIWVDATAVALSLGLLSVGLAGFAVARSRRGSP